jgi:putative hemolysin
VIGAAGGLLVSAFAVGVQAAFFVLFVAASALFAACETALSTAPSFYRERLGVGTETDRRSLGPPTQAFTAVLVGKHLANVAAGGLAVAIAVTALPVSLGWAVVAGIALGGLVLVTAAEVAPRVIASRDPEERGPDLTSPIRAAQVVLAPAVGLIEALSELTEPGDLAPKRVFLDEPEIRGMLRAGRRQDVLAAAEIEMIEAVLDFGDEQVGDVMAPRTDVVAIEASAPVEEVAQLVTDTGYSRLPVFREDLDNIVGVVYGKDVLDAVQDQPKASADSVMKETLFVPETTPLDEILREMKTRRIHMAIVHDEFGGTAGLVTLEDILEEIVGDIFDEYDPAAETVEWVDEAEAIFDARTDIEQVNDELELDLPDDAGYETLGGFLFHELGRPGRAGETIEHEDVMFTLEEVANRRILTVRVRLADADEA